MKAFMERGLDEEEAHGFSASLLTDSEVDELPAFEDEKAFSKYGEIRLLSTPASDCKLATSAPSKSNPFDYNESAHEVQKAARLARTKASMSDGSIDDKVVAASWSPRPAIELLSRSAKRWKSNNVVRSAQPSFDSSSFTPWDFSKVSDAVDSASAAFELGCGRAERPLRCGVSGTYFLKREDEKASVLCVFKPTDEEHDSFDNNSTDKSVTPPWLSGTTQCPMSGFNVGEGAYREVAAYLLDHENFACVPQTALVRCQLPMRSTASEGGDNYSYSKSTCFRTKMGAFQDYVPNVGDADDYGPLVLPKEKAQRIAVFDIRTLNHDRHGGNLLVNKGPKGFDLTPIDHGYILPTCISSCPWPIWMDWPCIKEPISYSTKMYVESLSAERDAKILSEEVPQLCQSALRHLKFATILLQKGVQHNLTLYDIGKLIFARNSHHGHVRSELAKVIEESTRAGLSREAHLENGNEFAQGSFAEEVARLKGSNENPQASMRATKVEMSEAAERFVLKYAGRLMDELIQRVVAKKIRKNPKGAHRIQQLKQQRSLLRARSIPDYAFQELIKKGQLCSDVPIKSKSERGQGKNHLPPSCGPPSSDKGLKLCNGRKAIG